MFGVRCSFNNYVYRAEHIQDIKFINSEPQNITGHSTVTVVKPVAKRTGRSISVSECTTKDKAANSQQLNNSNISSKSKAVEVEPKPSSSNNEFAVYKNGTPNKKDKWTKGWRDEACFGMSMDQSKLQDFDFEKNLALFDKEGLWKKLNASQKPDIVRQTDVVKNTKVQKYR